MESIKKYILVPIIDSIPLELIQADFGLKGFAVIVKLHQEIFKQQSYYFEAQDDVISLFAKRNGASYEVVSEIISGAVRRGYFDKALYDRYKILTNEFIQENYFVASKRQKKVEVVREYLVGNAYKNYENVYISSKNVNISDKNVNISATNEIKRNEIKGNNIRESKPARHKYGQYLNVLLSDEELEIWKTECPQWLAYINDLSGYMTSSGKSYKNHLATLRNWYRRDKEQGKVREQKQASYDLEKETKKAIDAVPVYERRKK